MKFGGNWVIYDYGRWNDQTPKQVMPMKVKDIDIRKKNCLKFTSTEERQTQNN